VRPLTQRYKFEDGELDFIGELAPTDAAVYGSDARWSAHARWVVKQTTNAIYLNTELPPFHDRAMRRAVSFAVDPSVLQKVRADVLPIDRIVPAGIPGPDRSATMRRHDPAAALAEMVRAGYPFDPATGRGGYPHEIEYLTVPDSFEQAAAEIYQQQLARVGIRIRLRLATFASYLAESTRRRTSAMGWAGWRADFPDPSNFFEPTLSSKAIHDENSGNRAFFSHAELDDVLARAHAERDTAQRMALYLRAEEIVRDEAPWVPTHTARSLQLWHPYVRGYQPHPVLALRLAGVWLDRAPGAGGLAARGTIGPLAAWLGGGGGVR
jgi:ABC-type transport system substrate-binding protein